MNRAWLIELAHWYENGKDARLLRDVAEPGNPGWSARSLAAEGRGGIMRDIHKAWQKMARTDDLGIYVVPKTKTKAQKIEGPFLVFVQALWMEAGLDPPPARTVRKIITGF